MHIDLDYIYDPDPQQQERNLGHLLDRINAMGVNTVYLQAFSDPMLMVLPIWYISRTVISQCVRTCLTV